MNQPFIEYIKSIDHAVTHAGKFHADDVFSVALLHYINPDIKIERVNKVPEDYTGLAFDIGFGAYDHHQLDKRLRENGVPYAAFGLLWESLGSDLIGEEEAKKFDQRFIEPLDVNDNFGEEHVIARAVSNFNPTWDSDEDAYEAFIKASEWALGILKGEFAQMEGRKRAKDLVEAALAESKDGILILKQSMPWKKYVKDTDITFAIYPSNRGGYCAQAVPSDFDYKVLKCPFNSEWCGKTEDEIKEISGIETATFCHNSGFLFSALTLEDCIKACNLSREKQQAEKQAEGKTLEQASEEPVVLNLSTSSSIEWSEEKLARAESFGKIIDLELPDVNVRTYRGISFPEEGMDITKSEKEKRQEAFANMVDDCVKKVMSYDANAVIVEGDAVLTFAIVRKLMNKKVRVLAPRYDQNNEFRKFVKFEL
ncbi:MAG: MYG1 family protein [bacterium]|nr:MYG1 family protein [bacterium]